MTDQSPTGGYSGGLQYLPLTDNVTMGILVIFT